MIVKAQAGEQRVLLRGISWEMYERLVRELEDRAGVRLAYRLGSLELMSPSTSHESIKMLIGSMIIFYAVGRRIRYKSGGSMTFKRQDLERGLEPDQCFWVQNEPRVRGKDELDLTIDPAPDIAIEVEISRSSLDKLDIYASLGVGEVWRHDGEALHVVVLQPDGAYVAVQRSPALPGLPLAEVARVVAQRGTVDEMSLMDAFQQRVRDGFPGA